MGKPDEVLPVAQEVQAEIDRAEGKSWPLGSIERFAFYEQAKRCLLRDPDAGTPLLWLLQVQDGCCAA